MVEVDPAMVKLLYRIADEAEQGVLVTSDWATPPDHVTATMRAEPDSKTAK